MTDINVEELILRSGDSHFVSYSYSDGELAIVLDHNELGERIELRLRTPVVEVPDAADATRPGGNPATAMDPQLATLCRIELKRPHEALREENGFFAPAEKAGERMRERRYGLWLAYGFKPSAVEAILSLEGYSRLLSCVVMAGETIRTRIQS